MKAIISHDIDHITVWEHLSRDTIVPKYVVRMHIELLGGKITLREYTLRWSDLFKNKWQNIDELITFNNIHGIPNSFFVAVNKGIGLNYSRETSLVWIEQMKFRNCEIGLHGIYYNSQQQIDMEFGQFKELTGLDNFGIRMHYLKHTGDTYRMFSDAGYRYDSTEYSFRNPYRIGNMWEFPFQIMDGWIIENYKSWQSLNLLQAKENTKRLIQKAFNHDVKYLGIDFHDRYFSHAFKTWLEWYMWLVEYLGSNNVGFVNFDTAIRELEQGGENTSSL